MKKIKYLLISLLVSIGLKACLVNDEKKPIALKGTFINQSYLNRSSDTLLSAIPFYCTELVFDKPDSVLVKNGFEEYALKYEIRHDTCFVKKAYQHQGVLQDLVLLVLSDTSFVSLEQDFTGTKLPATFTKTSVFEGFEYGLNKATIAGKYALATPSDKQAEIITFTENGIIKGLSNFSKFSVCYSGDCMSEPLEAGNVIMLENSQNEVEFAVWSFDKVTKQLTIFKLEAPQQDIKGERAIKSTLLKLRKIV
jgi:hypothetical protein